MNIFCRQAIALPSFVALMLVAGGPSAVAEPPAEGADVNAAEVPEMGAAPETIPSDYSSTIPVIMESEAAGETAVPTDSAALSDSDASQLTGTSSSSTAQLPQLNPGRNTRASSSYLGGGFNVGIAGDTALGDSTIAVISKIGLTRNFSLRPAAVIDLDENITVLAPVTLDLPSRSVGRAAALGIQFAPYLGGGLAASTNGHLGPLVTGGIDIPLSSRITANAALNLGLVDEANIGLTLGVGYTIPSGF